MLNGHFGIPVRLRGSHEAKSIERASPPSSPKPPFAQAEIKEQSDRLDRIEAQLASIEMVLNRLLAAAYKPVVPEYDDQGRVIAARRLP